MGRKPKNPENERLTDRQESFCVAYVENGFNFYQAMLSAGYSDSYAHRASAKDFITPIVQKRLDELLEEARQGKGYLVATSTEVLMFLTKSMRGELTEEVVLKDETGCSKIVKKQIGAKERIKSAELLGKSYKLFTEKIEANMDVSGQVTFVDDMKDEDEIIYIEDQDYVINDDGSKTPIDSKLLEGDKDE